MFVIIATVTEIRRSDETINSHALQKLQAFQALTAAMPSPLSDSDRATLKQLFDQMVRFCTRDALGEVCTESSVIPAAQRFPPFRIPEWIGWAGIPPHPTPANAFPPRAR